MESEVIIGTELKFNLFIEPLGNIHAADYYFTIKAYSDTRASVVIPKELCVEIDADNFTVMVDTSALTPKKKLVFDVTAFIPDNDFEDILRTEVVRYETDITLIR